MPSYKTKTRMPSPLFPSLDHFIHQHWSFYIRDAVLIMLSPLPKLPTTRCGDDPANSCSSHGYSTPRESRIALAMEKAAACFVMSAQQLPRLPDPRPRPLTPP